MDELLLSGKKYISSKRASSLTGYAKDYIGQLARSGKVKASRVGRSWYVLEEDVLAHKNSLSGDLADHQPISQTKSLSGRLYSHRELEMLPKTWSEVKYFDDNGLAIVPLLTNNENNSIRNIKQNKDISDVKRSQIFTEKSVDSMSYPVRIMQESEVKNLQSLHIPELQPVRVQKHSNQQQNIQVKTLLGTLAMLLVVVLPLSGLFLGSQLTLELYEETASASFGLENFTLLMSALFESGASLIVSFYAIIVGSFGVYLQAGFNFFLESFSRLSEIIFK